MTKTIRLEAGSEIRLDDGRRLVLGKLLKSGGAGSVFLLPGATDLVAKVYHESMDLALYERKVTVMLQYAPDLPDLSKQEHAEAAAVRDDSEEGRIVQIAWPCSLLRDAHGQFRGFVMPKLDTKATIELEYVLQERQARAEGLPTGLGARLTLATNLGALLAALHREHYFVVDLKPLNVRFYRRSLYLAMLDCDGFSVHSPRERFPAMQFTAEYFAPELQAGGLTGRRDMQAAEEAQDRFAFAVVAFQLLNFGIHPYSGQPSDERVPTDLAGRIAGHLYAYGVTPHPRVRPSRVSGHALMPAALRMLFDRAFGRDPARRPSAQEWTEALTPYALRNGQLLRTCATDPKHQHYVGLACAACARAALIGQVGAQAKATRKDRTRTAAHAANAPGGPRRAGHPAASAPVGRSPGGRPAATAPMGALGWVISFGVLFLALGALSTSCGTPQKSTTYSSAAPAASPSGMDGGSGNGTAQNWSERADTQLDALLRAAASDDAKGYSDGLAQLGETARRLPRVGTERRQEARSAAAEYNSSLLKRERTPAERTAGRLAAQRMLERSYEANPYQSELAAELSITRMITQLTTQRSSDTAAASAATGEASPAGPLAPAGEAIDALPTLRRAVVLDPAAWARWNALALGCLHHSDLRCAEGAFAIGVLMQIESAGRSSSATVIGQLRGDMIERYFGGAGKVQLQAAKARGLEHAVRLGGAAVAELVAEPPSGPARADQLAGRYTEGSGLIPLCVNAHYRACGLLDRQGAWRVTPRFGKIEENAGGWVVETAAGGQGLLDRDGQQLIAPLWHDLGRFASGLLPAQTARGEPYGYVDARGRWVIAPQFMYPAAFNRHAAMVWVPGERHEDRRLALVDPTGKLTFLPYSDAQNEDSTAERAGRFVVTRVTGLGTEMGVIDDSGRVRVPLAVRQSLELVTGGNWIDHRPAGPTAALYSADARRLFTVRGAEAYIRTPHANGHAVFTDEADREGLLDVRTGEITIPPSSRSLGILSDDRISFSADSEGRRRYGYLDLRGRLLIAPQFDNAPTFDRGLAALCETRPEAPGGPSLSWEQRQACRVVDSSGRALDAFTRFEAHRITLGAWTAGAQEEIVRDIVKVERRRALPAGERLVASTAADSDSARETLLTTRRGDVLVRVQTDPACDRERVVNARGEVIWPLQDSVLCQLHEVGRTLPVEASPALASAFAERAAFEATQARDRLRLRLRSYRVGALESLPVVDSATTPTGSRGP